MTDHAPEGQKYAPPRLTPLGSVHELTQGSFKWFGDSDGHTFIVSITTVSF